MGRGFLQYEISNFSKSGFQSIHNRGYWRQTPYLGLGTSAHSYNLISRQWNHKKIKKYIKDLNNGILDFEKEILTDVDKYNEYIMLALRTIEGISVQYVKENFDSHIYEYFAQRYFANSTNYFANRDDNQLLIADYLAKSLLF
jgi:oxygen-independent coproporphyrinogen-3 oxidase